MEGPELNVLVLQYLQQKGYLEAERALRQELDQEPNMALAHQLDVIPLIAEGLAQAAADSDPEKFIVAYDRLATWIDNSLDMYRAELQRLLYPVFIHCYLQLVEAGATALATQLMGQYRRRLVDLAGRLSRARESELQELATVAMPQHVASNRTAQAARGTKHSVKLCTYSYELLMNFLNGAKLWVVLGVINAHIKFEVTEGFPVVEEADGNEEEEEAMLVGQEDAGTIATNSQPVRLGLLQGNFEDLFHKKADGEDGAAGEGEEEGAGSKEPKSKKQRTAGGEAAAAKADKAAAKTKRKDPAAERIEPTVTVLPLSDEQQAEMMEHIRQRAELGPSSLPSCCMFTFFNTRQSLAACAFNLDGSKVAGGFADSCVRMYDVASLCTPAVADEDDEAGPQPGVTYLHGHTGPIHALDFSHDSRMLLSASSDGSVRLWSTELGVALAAFPGHTWPVWDVAASPQGGYFASGSADRTAWLWSTERLHPLRIFAGHQSDVDVVSWHPNGHYLATGSSDRTVRLWDLMTGSCVRFMAGQQANITSLAVHPEGRVLASGGDDGSLVLWDLLSGRKLASTTAHEGAVWSLAFSHGDGAVLASGGADATLRYWARAATSGAAGAGKSVREQPLKSLKSYPTRCTPIFNVRFTPRNLLMASGALTLPNKSK